MFWVFLKSGASATSTNSARAIGACIFGFQQHVSGAAPSDVHEPSHRISGLSEFRRVGFVGNLLQRKHEVRFAFKQPDNEENFVQRKRHKSHDIFKSVAFCHHNIQTHEHLG